MNLLKLICCLLLWSGVDAAFKDFVVEPEYDLADNALDMDLQEESPEDLLVSFQSVERDGIVDTELLLKALMQHAQRLGLSLDELANMRYAAEEDDEEEEDDNQLDLMAAEDQDQHMLGCNGISDQYAPRPSWRDLIFN